MIDNKGLFPPSFKSKPIVVFLKDIPIKLEQIKLFELTYSANKIANIFASHTSVE